jgi:hypothetical protein
MIIFVLRQTYRALVITVWMPKGIQVEAMTCSFGPSGGTFAEHVPQGLRVCCRA